MNHKITRINVDQLSQHWMAWLAMRHFLPARLLREIVMIVVSQGTNGRLGLQCLFEEVFCGDTLWNECWMVRPRQLVEQREYDGERRYFMRLVRALAWQNDDDGWAQTLNKADVDQLYPELIDAIVRFGTADFGRHPESLERQFGPVDSVLQESFRDLLIVFKIAQRDHRTLSVDDFWRGIGASTQSLCMPLLAVVMKHVADLCADADVWDKALAGYERASDMLTEWDPEAGWEDVTSAWKACIIGSRGAALAVAHDDPATQAQLLDDALPEASLETDPLRVANLSLDAFVALSHPQIQGRKNQDRRLSIAQSPLLRDSHNFYTPMSYWLRGKHEEAGRRFWGLLRRQIALGARVDFQNTKMWYGWSIIDDLSERVEKNILPEAFQLAVRMLVESGNSGVIKRISWAAPLLKAYVNHACIKMVIDHARQHKGATIARALVVVELFKKWIPELRGPAHHDAILLMWRHIATLATEFEAEFEQRVDVGRPSLEALQELAKKRPELRSEVAPQVQQAICKRLSSPADFWDGSSKACNTASEYADAFDATSMESVISAVVNRLKNISPDVDLWPVTRAALAFLVLEPVTKHARDYPATGKSILEQILRIGLEQKTEHSMLLYYIHDFDGAMLADADVRTKLNDKGIVKHLLEEASQLGSSNAMDSIKALLFAPLVSGRDGISGALESLKRTLHSAKNEHLSYGLAFAYDAILILINFQQKIQEMFPGDEEWIRAAYHDLLACIVVVWRAAASRPLIFAPFSLPPPTQPNPVIIHNWAFASLRFAETLDQTAEVEAALREASTNMELAPHIALARATRAVARPIDNNALEEARTADPEIFYTTIGRRLAQIKASTSDPTELCRILIEQCFRFGPKEIDAAVFLEAARLGLHGHVRASGLRDYAKRLEGDRERRLVLAPILDLFSD
ncbi:hypothetical protein WME97_39950 [Sorangium sp. So ce367]|uniref:hypothetical protein n=1 Tax=Sorangium sp. So ce367 TaxID=3133305 RepID=UPI003F5DE4B9